MSAESTRSSSDGPRAAGVDAKAATPAGKLRIPEPTRFFARFKLAALTLLSVSVVAVPAQSAVRFAGAGTLGATKAVPKDSERAASKATAATAAVLRREERMEAMA